MFSLFRVVSLVVLSFVLTLPILASPAFGREPDRARLEKEAGRAAHAYVGKMAARCKGFSYLKAGGEIWEFKGAIRVVLHEPLERISGKGVTLFGNYETLGSVARVHYRNEGWGPEEGPSPLIAVRKIRGTWKGSGLEKVVCQEVRKLGNRMRKTDEGQRVDRETIAPPLSDRFTLSKDGIISDSLLGLEWAPAPDRAMNWLQARNYAHNLSLGGGGWRLPTKEELKSIYDKSMNGGVYPAFHVGDKRVWTGENNTASTAVYFDFLDRGEGWTSLDQAEGRYRALAVRSRK